MLLPLNEFWLDTFSRETEEWRRLRPQTHKTVTMEKDEGRVVWPHYKKLLVPAKLMKKAVQIVGGSRTADKKEHSEGLRNCQGSPNLAASSYVKTPAGGGKCRGL